MDAGDDSSVGDMFRPPINRAMRVLDRSFFRRDVALTAARIKDPKSISATRSALEKSKDILSQRMITPIKQDSSSNAKCILLNTHYNATGKNKFRQSRLSMSRPFSDSPLQTSHHGVTWSSN